MDNNIGSKYFSLDFISTIIQMFSIEGVDGEVVVSFLLIFILSIFCLTKFVKSVLQSLETRREGALNVQPPPPSYNRSEEPCPVCYSAFSFAVETSCCHLFCGSCMLGLIQYALHRNITCPVCRARVSMLYPIFTVDEYNTNSDSDLGRIRVNLTSEIQEYNNLFSGGNRTIIQTIFELPVFVRRLWRSFNNPNDVFVQNRMKTLLYIILFLVTVYILFPFDLLPEVYFGVFGYVDDIFVLAVSLFYLTSVYRGLFFDLHHHT